MIFSVCEQALIFLPLVFGSYLILSLLKLPDFSIESAYLFGAVTAYLAKELPFPVVVAAAMMGASVVALTVCFLNQVFGIPFLIAAIATNGLFHGLTQYALGTSVASFHLPSSVNEPLLLGLCAAGFCLFFLLLLRSQLGYSLAIYGNNVRFFENHQISKGYVVTTGVVFGHMCAGLSGFLFAQSVGFVDLTMNYGIILTCLTALMLGKLVIANIRPSLFVPLIGLVAFFCIQHALLTVGLNLKYFNAFQALVIVGILYAGKKSRPLNFDHLGV